METVTLKPKPAPNPTTIGMLIFLASEAVFFALLITAYIYFGAGANSGKFGSESLEPVKTGIFTAFLLASSLTIWVAEQYLERHKTRAFTLWLLLTILLGGVFLVGQGLEYLHLIGIQITINQNVFGTTFFTLTGFHGLHVLAGLIMLGIVAGLFISGQLKHFPRAISYYWHFVDVVWVVVFSVIYIGALVR